ncbi:hypothetical protein PRIPAC_81002 [Pristionchus pacificus]|uniref:Uncharacterized protein n=1 Tax=Pristionchus pacificus TaxID=54126 RepID=A0A2A6C2Z2_PRIPA|nr:hypothetical protein PRIPAC_81002 [Pristionchus pacificus]|eukprot:PDM72506.1 hypothetical protein PRIPAC_38940 [Pristionchus pacificus]
MRGLFVSTLLAFIAVVSSQYPDEGPMLDMEPEYLEKRQAFPSQGSSIPPLPPVYVGGSQTTLPPLPLPSFTSRGPVPVGGSQTTLPPLPQPSNPSKGPLPVGGSQTTQPPRPVIVGSGTTFNPRLGKRQAVRSGTTPPPSAPIFVGGSQTTLPPRPLPPVISTDGPVFGSGIPSGSSQTTLGPLPQPSNPSKGPSPIGGSQTTQPPRPVVVGSGTTFNPRLGKRQDVRSRTSALLVFVGGQTSLPPRPFPPQTSNVPVFVGGQTSLPPRPFSFQTSNVPVFVGGQTSLPPIPFPPQTSNVPVFVGGQTSLPPRPQPFFTTGVPKVSRATIPTRG